jgi:hypothetical protein
MIKETTLRGIMVAEVVTQEGKREEKQVEI